MNIYSIYPIYFFQPIAILRINGKEIVEIRKSELEKNILCREEGIMVDKDELCNKIREVFPDIGECEIDVNIEYDEKNGAYIVHLKKGNRRLKTYLETEDADVCMDGRQCVGLGLQIAQLRANIEAL
jgi:hypothetical protein